MASGLVLIGFDGTPASEQAVRAAAALFPGRSALVITAWEQGRAFDLAMIPSRGFELPLSSVDIGTAMDLDKAMYKEAQQLAQWGAQLANENGLPATGLAIADVTTPADTLVQLAKDRDAEVLVVGAHKHGRLAEVLFGTTTRGVLRHAPCPVLVIRHDAEE